LAWIETLIAFATAAAATALGVFFAFTLDRRRERASRKERLIGALQMIRDEVERNLGECKHIQDDFAKYGPKYVQYYNLKTTTWEAVSPALVDLKSPELTKKIANEYYQYYHENRKLDARFDLFKFGTSQSPFAALTNAVLLGAQTLSTSGGELLDAINKETRNLRDC
jgi:hypothetical protein